MPTEMEAEAEALAAALDEVLRGMAGKDVRAGSGAGAGADTGVDGRPGARAGAGAATDQLTDPSADPGATAGAGLEPGPGAGTDAGPVSLSGGPSGPEALEPLIATVLEALAGGAKRRDGPIAPGRPEDIAAAVAEAFDSEGEGEGGSGSGSDGEGETGGEGTGAIGVPTGHPRRGARALARTDARGAAALRRLTELLAHGSADPADPSCAAHLHCPPLAIAVAADLAVSALNPSQDSWDQAPAATALETLLLKELARLVGYDAERAAGVLTSGGTESNLMGLMLARDRVLGTATGEQIEMTGVPGTWARVPGQRSAGMDETTPARPRHSGRTVRPGRPRILASAAAHFSVQRAAALLGLGEDAVLPVPVDHELRMIPEALASLLDGCAARGELPVAVVATAGTTDTGSIDPLRACAELAAEHGAWLHVDAAYGGGALLSDRLAPLLDGLELADSVSLDWHKLGWQPAAAGIFLVRRAETYASLARRAVYLNPADDEEAGYPSLLGLSLRTTRRADAFKIAVTLRALGREGLGRLVDACRALAVAGARTVREHPRLELHSEPVLTAFLFRYLPSDASRGDEVNAALRRRLLREGRAVVGRTELPGEGPGRVRLKLTLLNPHTTPAEVDRLLHAVVAAGRAEEEGGG
ncbi:pyridoxal phosphate-dependent decarboxylase family protein [Streptomyces sp. NRRL F-5135]|uniref:pyridoxal phosphate-dependent decarboxylase family protein n=1 Tax=Streptomyces sp. NRRL F-5135 TaxID=1463858 RepID=UPI000AA8257E|nr:pyridoxal-dependent decarboxylase [Streptomyces sp. NRRL F-5135]